MIATAVLRRNRKDLLLSRSALAKVQPAKHETETYCWALTTQLDPSHPIRILFLRSLRGDLADMAMLRIWARGVWKPSGTTKVR